MARASQPFVVIDCSALPANLIESELFGHTKGSFTGAQSDYRGAFERADGGTVFLDEIGELPLELQPKLLRALEQREIRRVGGGRSIKVDARIIAATNRNLEEAVQKGEFRDVIERLQVMLMQAPEAARVWLNPHAAGTTDATFDHSYVIVVGRKPL